MRLRATRLSATGGHTRKRGIDIAALFAAYPGRVGCYYGTKSGPSYTDILARNREALGPELVPGSAYQSSTNWNLSSNVTIAGGAASFSAAAQYSIAGYYVTLTPGKTYVVTTVITGLSSGSVKPITLGGTQVTGSNKTATGTYVELITAATGNDRIALQAGAAGTTAQGRIYAQEITDWSKLVLFDDANGTVPVFSVFQSSRGRGLLLDASQGLVRGAELVDGVVAPVPTRTSVESLGGGVSKLTATSATDPIVGWHKPMGTVLANKWVEIELELWTDAGQPTAATIYSYDAAVGEVVTRVVALTTTPTKYRLVRSFSASNTQTTFTTRLDMQDGASAVVGSYLYFRQVSVRELPGNHMVQPTAAARGELSARYNLLTGTDTLSTQSVTTIAASHTLRFSGAGSITLSGAATGTYTAGTHTITTTAASLTLTVSGSVTTADLRLTADAIPSIPAYQRVTSATDYDDVGFPVHLRVQTDDWAKTRINPSGATKALLMWAGQKMASSAQIVLESSASSGTVPGSVAVVVDSVVAESVLMRSTGSASSSAQAAVMPVGGRRVVRGRGDIQADVCDLLVNGTLVATNSADQGTGSYTEQDVFFGARGGTSLFANVREFAPPLILFQPAADTGLSASQITALDKAYAKAAGVTL